MKYLLGTSIIIGVVYCFSPYQKWYPDKIVQLGLQSQYDIALLEMYKSNSQLSCKCFGVANLGIASADTLNVLSLDVELSNFEERGDTLVFYFRYYKRHERLGDVAYYPTQSLGGSYTECFFNAFAFIGSSMKPISLSFGDGFVMTDYHIDSDFELNILPECLEEIELSETLKEVLLRVGK